MAKPYEDLFKAIKFTTDFQYDAVDLSGDMAIVRTHHPVGQTEMILKDMSKMPHGIIFIYGALSPEPMTVPALELLAKSIDLRGYWLAEITFPTSDPTRLARGKRFVNEGLADGSLKPIIAKTFPLEEIVEAHRYLESNQQIGKVVVRV